MNEVSGNQIAALLLPASVTVVGAYDEHGDACVATIAWAMPISHDPSMMAVSIRPGGRTSCAMAESGYFTLNMLPADAGAVDTALICGKKAGVDDRLAEAGISVVRGMRAKAPCIEQAVSWVECELVEHRPYGDHELFIGRTLAARTRGSVSEVGTVAPPDTLAMGQRGVFGHLQAI